MAETFREREKPPEQRVLPTISREQELHGALDSLGRIARHLRIPHEQTRSGGATAVARSDRDMSIARNVSDLRLEGSSPLHARFLSMLESMQ